MSSTYHEGNGPDKCIDGITDGPDSHPGDLCHTSLEPTPWLALAFGNNSRVSVETVLLYNRMDSSANGARAKNVEIRISDELPTSGTTMFPGGHLLGTFAGPGTSGQQIEIKSGPAWRTKIGRYLIVQMDNGQGVPLNLKEVAAFGVHHQGEKR